MEHGFFFLTPHTYSMHHRIFRTDKYTKTVVHEYWCLKTEALKSNCKRNKLIAIVDLDL